MPYVLRTTSGMFYTGRAGEGWLSPRREDAFTYAGKGEADRKAATFNRATLLHRHTFEVEG